MSTFKIIINDGVGTATRGMKRSHTFTRTVKAKDLANALIKVWEDLFEESFEETIEEELDDVNEFYKDPLIFVENLDCSSGEPFIEEIYEGKDLIFSYFD